MASRPIDYSAVRDCHVPGPKGPATLIVGLALAPGTRHALDGSRGRPVLPDRATVLLRPLVEEYLDSGGNQLTLGAFGRARATVSANSQSGSWSRSP